MWASLSYRPEDFSSSMSYSGDFSIGAGSFRTDFIFGLLLAGSGFSSLIWDTDSWVL